LTLDGSSELRRRTADDVEAEIVELLSYVGRRQNLHRFAVKVVDDRGRGPGGRHDPEPRHGPRIRGSRTRPEWPDPGRSPSAERKSPRKRLISPRGRAAAP